MHKIHLSIDKLKLFEKISGKNFDFGVLFLSFTPFTVFAVLSRSLCYALLK